MIVQNNVAVEFQTFKLKRLAKTLSEQSLFDRSHLPEGYTHLLQFL
jgi:hypothetical protein